MPPEHPFPAAVDDAVAVYKALLKSYQAQNIGIFGGSAGGGLAAATVIAARDSGLPLPGAVALNTPWSDLSKTGDTYFTNEWVDTQLPTYEGPLGAAARLYAGKYDLKHFCPHKLTLNKLWKHQPELAAVLAPALKNKHIHIKSVIVKAFKR